MLMLEGQINATPKSAPQMQGMLMSVTQMACAVGDLEKAKLYFARITDATKRQEVIEACRMYKVTL
jgi:hypothetical protein